MLHEIEVVGGGKVPEIRLLGPKGRSNTPDMSDSMFMICYYVIVVGGEIVPVTG